MCDNERMGEGWMRVCVRMSVCMGGGGGVAESVCETVCFSGVNILSRYSMMCVKPELEFVMFRTRLGMSLRV